MIIDHLFVMWAAAGTGRRHVIGHLRRVGKTFSFAYESDLSTAAADGFRLLPAFPEHRVEADPYPARYLWTTFADRIPQPGRSDAAAILDSWGVENRDDQFEVLARSGGLRATDRIELAEFRSTTDPLVQPLEFRIAGARHLAPEMRASLTRGQALVLQREPDHAVDSCATLVVASTGQRAGYVPRQYSKMIASLLDAGVGVRATVVRELSIPDDAGRWVVRAERE